MNEKVRLGYACVNETLTRRPKRPEVGLQHLGLPEK